MRLRQRGSEKPSRRDEDGAESILYGRLEASEERQMRLRQREAFKERWEDQEGAESILHGRLEASEERERERERDEIAVELTTCKISPLRKAPVDSKDPPVSKQIGQINLINHSKQI